MNYVMRVVLLGIVASHVQLVNAAVESHPGMFVWSDAAAWTPAPPIAGDDITINQGSIILMDASPEAIGKLMVRGELQLDDVDLDITAERIMIDSGGLLVAGSELTPLSSQITITLNEIDAGSGAMGDRVLGVMTGGELQLHGKRRDSRSWTQITADVEPGDTQLHLLENVDWQPGDQIALAPSGYDPFEAEQLTVTDNIGGRIIQVTPPLEFAHLGRVEVMAGKSLDMRAEVGLLTRNIVVQAPVDSQHDEFGFHAMFMPNSTVNIEGVEFRRGGQIRKPARYSVHWHRGASNNDGSDDYIRRSSIHDSFQRGIVTHGIDNVLVEENVVFNVFGHAYIPSEDGVERDNIYQGNLAMLYKRRDSADFSFPRDDHTLSNQAEHRSSGFWYRNYHNILIGNHAAGGDEGIGFFIDSRLLSNSVRSDIVEDSRPIIFKDNLAHSHKRHISGAANPSYGPRTRATGLMVGNYHGSEYPVVFSSFSTYKNSFAGVWMETHSHTLQDSVMADSSVGYLVRRANITDGVFNQASSNTIGGPVQVMGNRSHPGGGIHIEPGSPSTISAFRNITMINVEPAAIGVWKNPMTFGDPPVTSAMTLVNTEPYLQFSSISSVTAYYTDLDGSLTGTGNITHIGGPDLFPNGIFYPEYNAYVYDTGVSQLIFADSMESELF